MAHAAPPAPPTGAAASPARVTELRDRVVHLSPEDGARMLRDETDATIAAVLARANPALALDILWRFDDGQRARVFANASEERRRQWELNHTYPEGTVGRMMDPPSAVFPPELTVHETLERLREMVKHSLISYAFVVDKEGKLIGVLVFRDMLFSRQDQTLDQVMIKNPFALPADMTVMDAMREVLTWHHPAYPVRDKEGRLVGTIRGQTLFQQQAIEISAQAGSMVGVEKEERLATPWWRSLRFRHPWLQLNLLTAFVAAAVVGVFQETIDKIVVLAVFLPVLAGQSGNTGCQALAVTLRGITLGELKPGNAKKLVLKEAWLGFLNGGLVGITAGAGMYFVATRQGNADAWVLALVVALAMIGACVASGISGVVVPVTLRRLGADPATASSIFLTTATDVASMGLFLGLATMVIR